MNDAAVVEDKFAYGWRFDHRRFDDDLMMIWWWFDSNESRCHWLINPELSGAFHFVNFPTGSASFDGMNGTRLRHTATAGEWEQIHAFIFVQLFFFFFFCCVCFIAGRLDELKHLTYFQLKEEDASIVAVERMSSSSSELSLYAAFYLTCVNSFWTLSRFRPLDRQIQLPAFRFCGLQRPIASYKRKLDGKIGNWCLQKFIITYQHLYDDINCKLIHFQLKNS